MLREFFCTWASEQQLEFGVHRYSSHAGLPAAVECCVSEIEILYS